MSHLGENLASKGYVTVSIDHTDSTYSDQAAFGSTLLNRPLDQRFVLDQMGDASVIGEDIAAITDAQTAGLIGYSMVVVVLLLLAFYRSLSLTLITVVPIFLTWLLTIGLMGLLNLEFNIFNFKLLSII